MIRHEIENCLASIKMVNYMMLEPDLSAEDRSELRRLRQEASARLSELVGGARLVGPAPGHGHGRAVEERERPLE
ncbi:MAG: hypothetical protein L0229_17565, partial [Blastocatellia bacterium]|nr:hypothetical protein [Blastocatellia bacterium]